MPLTKEEIHERVIYHAPSPMGVSRHQALATVIEIAMDKVNEVCPEGREKSLAMTNLEQAKFWASAAVARNPDTR